MHNLVDLFCHVDDFCKLFMPQWQKYLIESGQRQRLRPTRMTTSEIMTIIIAFHMSHQRDFKHFYIGFITVYHKKDFPSLLSYTRFLEVMPTVLAPLSSFFTHLKGQPTGLEFIDSTSIKVCHNLRIPRHQVFKGAAARGKGTMGWFYGFKLHIIVNHLGEIVAAKLTSANVDDRTPVKALSKGLLDKLYADKGYISKALTEELEMEGITLVTGQRKNMKPKLLAAWDRAMLAKRFIIETINDQLKNITQIEHSRHRSLHGFMLNLLGGLIAYCLKPKKPSLNLSNTEKTGLQVMA
ncbi:IS982 family transposase [Xenorhabdus nematophila]|uniref:IS982 family transposase n=3 Tax=Xenorhabdus nematophila TaxID=628 RepID=UPI0003275254|nr:IS982 family transposase [Xenorhabdus nematophila]CEF29678.1 transposase [Xenorhabdus nematophila str. Websteri]AYA39373.1 IS982 family transposase [Xenorhabdus nematophila]AYA41149.1 IS982 family transposase [Xenorhabdus nematophila]AYA41189.1 IS982 family transposase [Xenorhabdus nematophila]AYA41979.1 IS982 family transposase [Xenorhabdus nematophila]